MVENPGSENRPRQVQLLAQGDFLRRLAARLVRDQDVAADLVQETWLVALRRQPRRPDSLQAWLGRIVRHLAWKRHRSEERRRRIEQRSARSEAAAPAAQVVEMLALQRRVEAALESLRKPHRLVIELRYLHGLPREAIAERLGISTAAVKTRLKRGLARLRQSLDDGHGGDQEQRAGRVAWLAGRRPVPPRRWSCAAWMPCAAGVMASLAFFTWYAASEAATSLPRPSNEIRELDRPSAAVQDAVADAGVRSPVAVGGSAAPDEPAAVTGSLLVHVRWGGDGRSAAGVAVRAVAWGGRDPLLHSRRETSDAAGVVRFAGLAPGRVTLTADRGGRAVSEALANAEQEVELRVPAGVDIEGVVVAPGGTPVGGSLIWLSEPRDAHEGAFVRVADADGRFELQSVSPSCWVGARAAGFAPTSLLAVRAGGVRSTVVLELGPGGGDVEGVVLGPAGEPVVGAVVLLGATGPAMPWREGNALRTAAPGFAVTTDARGAFRAVGFTAGPTRVLARAPTLGRFEGEALVQPGGTTYLQICLPAGASLRGTVRDRAGTPVPHAIVGVGSDHVFDAFTSSRESFLASAMRARIDGTFELQGLAAGEIEAWAMADGERVQQALCTTPGRTTTWDPVVGVASCHGRVLDHLARPLVGWLVDPTSAPSKCPARLPPTDAEGRFTLAVPPASIASLVVREPSTGRICVRMSGWPAHAGEVQIVVPERDRPSAHVIGQVHDAAGALVRGARVRAVRDGEQAIDAQAVDADGRFRIGPLPPDVYRLAIDAPGHHCVEIATPSLAPGEEHSVGPLVLTRR